MYKESFSSSLAHLFDPRSFEFSAMQTKIDSVMPERCAHSTALTVTNQIYEASADARNRLTACPDTEVLTSSIIAMPSS